MTLSSSRRPDPLEVPRFGSVWRWRTEGYHYFVLRTYGAEQGRTYLSSIILETGEKAVSMVWAHPNGVVVDGWTCVEEESTPLYPFARVVLGASGL